MKFCKKCGVDAERNAAGKCKPCERERFARYRAENRDMLRERSAVYRSANREKLREYDAEYRSNNADKARASSAKWAAANRERVRATTKAWAAKNPDKARAVRAAWRAANKGAMRIHQHNRRAREREAGGKLSPILAARLLKLQKGKCACGCKQPLGDDFHLDHIMPLALGGTNTDDNIQLLTATCNLQKNAKHPVDFMQQRGFLL